MHSHETGLSVDVQLKASPPDSPLPFREGKQVLTARCIEAEETMVSRRSIPRACSHERCARSARRNAAT